MEIKITSEKENPLLKRKEVRFMVAHDDPGGTPTRLETRKSVASALKANTDLVFIKRFVTKTGTRTAYGYANIYDSVDQAKLVEPSYIVERNVPSEKPKEEAKAK